MSSLLFRFILLVLVAALAATGSFLLAYAAATPWLDNQRLALAEAGMNWQHRLQALEERVATRRIGNEEEALALGRQIERELGEGTRVCAQPFGTAPLCATQTRPDSKRMHWLPAGQWGTLHVSVPAQTEAMAGALARYNRTLGLLFLFSAGVGVTLLLWVMRRQIGRLDAVRHALSRLPADFETRLPAGGRDEVAELERSFNRMAELSGELFAERAQMSAALAHDLRSPLTSLLLYLELAEGEDAPASRAEFLALARNKGAEIARLATQLQDFGAMTAQSSLATRVETVDVAALCRTLWAQTAQDAALRGLACAPPSGVDTSLGWPTDALLLERVLANLLANAVKYSTAGGTLCLSVYHTPRQLTVQVGNPAALERTPDPVLAALADGRPVRKESGGYGLGLNLVARLVGRLGGHFDFCIENGQCTATVRLPRLPAGPSARGVPPSG